MNKLETHVCDEDCTVGEDGCCEVCGVSHTATCARCGGHGYHYTGCQESESSQYGSDEGGHE